MRRFRTTLLALLLAIAAPAPAGMADQTSAELDGLFARLKASPDAAAAADIEGRIWEIWTHRGVAEVDREMAHGILAMRQGDLGTALAFFDEVVRGDPDFAEGWNKRATVYYLMGDFDASVADIKQTLALEPRHFGALSGMGLIYDAIGDAAAAVKVWEKALEINPHMPTIRHRIDEIRAGGGGKPI